MNRLSEAYRYSRPGITRTPLYEDYRYLRSRGWTAGQSFRMLRLMVTGWRISEAVREVSDPPALAADLAGIALSRLWVIR